MSAVKQIYNSKVTVTHHQMMVMIEYNNTKIYGHSSCHPDDLDFQSEKVGYNIAYKRAIISCLEFQTYTAETEWKHLKTVYSNVIMNHEDNPEVIDPTGRMKAALYRAEKHYHQFKNARDMARKDLKNYLEAQARVVDSLRRQRAKND